MDNLFKPDADPFNLRGEAIDNSLTAEGEARAKAEARAQAEKDQQRLFERDHDPKHFDCFGMTPAKPQFGTPPPKPKTYDEKLHEPYAGRFPRGAHSHKCDECGHRVACYKSRCTKGSRVTRCGWC